MENEEERSILFQRQTSLHDEVISIQYEIKILQALQKKTEEELIEVQTKIGELEGRNTIKLASAG